MLKVGIVGGGCSGMLSALAMPKDFRVTIFESKSLAEGVAYSTKDSEHRLNVMLSKMSAYRDKPSHFQDWALRTHGLDNPQAFVPRSWYPPYLIETLRQEKPDFLHVQEKVTDIQTESAKTFSVVTDKQTTLVFDFLVLALGIPESQWPITLPMSEKVISNPWNPGALDCVSGTDSVFLLGSGLTAVDIALTLAITKKFRGKIHLLSRHGLIPATHNLTPIEKEVTFPSNKDPTLKELRQWIRETVKSSKRMDKVVDALRPHTQRIWQNFSHEEKARFLNLYRSYWDVNRHRMAPEVGEKFLNLRKSGQVEIHTGNLLAFDLDHEQVLIKTKRGEERISTAALINCTGFGSLTTNNAPPLVLRLIESGLIKLDPLGLGFDPTSAVFCTPELPIGVIGAYLRAKDWECIAVPDLRIHACEVAEKASRLAS